MTLTEFVRREGPAEAVYRLILSSQPVTTSICRELGLDLSEVTPRTERTIPRILWKFGFEIPRHDDVLARLNRRLQKFDELLAEIDFSTGEVARERLRAEGVNLFVSVEEFLDRLLAFNVWLLASDHWGTTRFEYRESDARSCVSAVLGNKLETADGEAQWKINGENPLGTQLAYISAFDHWLENLAKSIRVERTIDDIGVDHCNRSFPFRHIQLWADADPLELERYKESFRKVTKAIAQADVAGIRNALDHQRDASRFPSPEQLLVCVTRLKSGVRYAEQHRIYPVTYWFDSSIDRVYGASEHSFKNLRGELFTIFTPSTVSSLPRITRIHPVVFATVNFLGAADSLLFFKLMGESEYSRYWYNYPRISKVIREPDGIQANEACLMGDGESPSAEIRTHDGGS